MNEHYEIYKTAQICSEIAKKMCLEFNHGIDPQHIKEDRSWVTNADQTIERKLRDVILSRHPSHFIMGEEEGGSISDNESDFTWILDPIDGTFSFVHNIPFYSSLIAVLKGKSPIIGVASLPALNITMRALKNNGVYINDKLYEKPKIIGNKCIEIVATADPYRFFMENKSEMINHLYGPTMKSRTYPDALGYYLLLNGSVRAFIDPKVEIWDIAPFYTILPEAGFSIQSWNGDKILQRGNCISFYCNEQNLPINCLDLIELTTQYA